MTLAQFLRLIRFPNIVIVALTQHLLQYYILYSTLYVCQVRPGLPYFPFLLLIITTCLIAASGYVVNDIEDVAIDRINKPVHKRIVERVISISFAWKIYWFCVVLGFLISIYLAFYIKDITQLTIYPIAVFLLWSYAKWLKKMPLIGNMVIAGFCAFVAWVVNYAQGLQSFYNTSSNDIQLIKDCSYYNEIRGVTFGGYFIFAFLSTLFREIVKDIEDVQGDLTEGGRTLPVVLGIEGSKKVASFVGMLFLLVIVFFNHILLQFSYTGIVQIFIFNIMVSLPTIYALYLLKKAKEKPDFTRLSFIAKMIMLSGIVFILIMSR
jgi:4-hydroxybenzoate polyprenyltransferase